MEGIYAGIVRNSAVDAGGIDRVKLEEYTSLIPFSQMDSIPWEKVEFLHIIGDNPYTPTGKSVEEIGRGCHLSFDGRWALVLDRYSYHDDKIVARCGDCLRLLNIVANSGGDLSVSHLKNLRRLRVYSTTIYGGMDMFIYSVHGIQDLHMLEHLDLSDVEFPGGLDVSGMPGLRSFRVDCPQLPVPCGTVTGIQRLRQLRHLSLYAVDWDCRLDISQLPDLKSLELRVFSDQGYITGVPYHPALKILRLSGNWLGPALDVSGLKNLKELNLSGNRKLCHIEGMSHLKTLEILNLSDTGIREVPIGIQALKNLKRLYLNSNGRLCLVDGLSHLEALEILNLSNTGIRAIPPEIRTLKNLKRLDLSGLELDELPDWLPELELNLSTQIFGNGILLRGTKIKDVDMSIFEQPQEVILQWFAERKKGNAVPLNEVKVVFLGDGEAGKTHTIARLLSGGDAPRAEHFDDKATPGIVIRDKEYVLDGTKIQVHFWDFGGQEILHSMHRMFLTERTLYVVVINARDDYQDDRARYWLHNIKSFAGSAPVLLVLNKIDQNPNASIDRPNLQKMYSGLKDVVRMSALEFDRDKFNATFTDALLRQVRELGTLGTLWPRSWLRLKSGLETMQTHYIHGGDYEDLCDDCGVEQNREELLHWFNDLGVSFCYGGSAKLEDYVILKPEWLTNAIYIILFNECPDAENGVIPHDAIYRMLQKPRKGPDPIRRVLPNVFYRPEEAEYVLDVVRKFRLSYKVREDAEFIPVLCQRETMAVAEAYENDPETLEFRMEFEYLPDNVLHRLMVEMRQDLDIRNVWRTGAQFVQRGTGLSAVVRSEGDVLRIFVRTDIALHLPNTYLHILKSNIDQIVTDMKLQPPYCEVIYKADGITEAFDYEDLIHALEDGETTYRSPRRRCRIPIRDILNQSGRTAEVELDQLRTDIITACMQLQGNSKFWDATEDERNSAVRDALRNMGYLVSDQSFQGISSGGKKAGELDLDIRKDARIPWTICEALKIKDGSKADWNAHLKKLLDNYNPSGLNYLFLLTYVDCDRTRFEKIVSSFSEHIRWYDPGEYERLPSSFSHIDLSAHNNPRFIRALRCTYDCGGSPTTVCHIFTRIGR